MKSTIRLFKAVPITTKEVKEQDKDLMAKTIAQGFVFSDVVIANYSKVELETLFNTVKDELGFNAQQANSSFHKSWQKVRDAGEELLIFEQIVHYFTTYGFEALGIYDKDSVYIPDEALDIPNLNLKLTVINGYTKEEFKAKLLDLLNSGIALKEETLRDVIEVALYVELQAWEIDNIRNKEVKATLYDYLGLVPQNATEFLRYIVYKATDSALLIKNGKTIATIKEKKNLDVLGLFEKYQARYGLEPLAEIFYRFKPLFLAFRTNIALKKIINKIRKLAVKNHKPMPEDFLNTVTAKLRNGKMNLVSYSNLEAELNKVNTFRKIRLAYALKLRTTNADSILYKVRNGKGYATEFKFSEHQDAQVLLDLVLNSIIKDVEKNVKDKKIYIPEAINYALPATEKQFTGMFPSGTYIEVPKDMVFGVHWDNIGHNRIDLDLSLLTTDQKYGWDASYRNDERTILFSGDMTDALKPNGASELFYVKKQEDTAVLMLVNYFNFDKEVEVPMDIFVAQASITKMQKNYMVNPAKILAVAKSSINQKQKILGVIMIGQDESRFYFSETYVGNSITSSNKPYMNQTRKYLFNFYTNTISLNEVLKSAGAKLVTNKTLADIDLSPESLEKDSIIKLLI
jgi:hypothetical protein